MRSAKTTACVWSQKKEVAKTATLFLFLLLQRSRFASHSGVRNNVVLRNGVAPLTLRLAPRDKSLFLRQAAACTKV